MSTDVLDSLVKQLSELRDTIAEAGYSSSPVWLGETSSCWGGGAPDLSDRYVAGFMWVLYFENNNNNNNNNNTVINSEIVTLHDQYKCALHNLVLIVNSPIKTWDISDTSLSDN